MTGKRKKHQVEVHEVGHKKNTRLEKCAIRKEIDSNILKTSCISAKAGQGFELAMSHWPKSLCEAVHHFASLIT